MHEDWGSFDDKAQGIRFGYALAMSKIGDQPVRSIVSTVSLKCVIFRLPRFVRDWVLSVGDRDD